MKRVASGKRMMVLDTLRKFHQGEENDSGHMTLLTQILDESAQALVRFCLSNKAVNMEIGQLISIIGISKDVLPASTVSRIRNKLIAMKDGFGPFGISIADAKPHIVTYRKHPDVWFRNPSVYDDKAIIGADS